MRSNAIVRGKCAGSMSYARIVTSVSGGGAFAAALRPRRTFVTSRPWRRREVVGRLVARVFGTVGFSAQSIGRALGVRCHEAEVVM
jgi:hypothetical protein